MRKNSKLLQSDSAAAVFMKKILNETVCASTSRTLSAGALAVLMAACLAGCSGGSLLAEKKTLPARETEAALETAAESASEVPVEVESEEAPETEPEAESAEETEPETEAVPEVEEDGTIRLVFSGDIYLSNYVLGAYDQAGGVSGILDGNFRDMIAGADAFVANEEFPFSERGTQAPDKQFTFRLPTSRLHIMNEIGADVVTLANNHTLDFGREALSDTLTNLDSIGIRHVGAGENLAQASEPVYLDIKGKKVAVLGATRVMPVGSWAAGANSSGLFSAYDSEAVAKKIREVRPNCDYLILMIHWGIERNTSPEGYQVSDGRKYIDAGADMVVGAHPHVLQGMEFYKGKPVLYSLGNFIFGSSIPSTMLVEAEISEAGEISLRALPGTSSGGYTRSHVKDGVITGEGQNVLASFKNMSKGIDVDAAGAIIPAGN